MVFYSQTSCKEIGKVLYNSTFKGRENGPYCQEMAFLANKSTGKNGKKWDIIDPNFEYAAWYVL